MYQIKRRGEVECGTLWVFKLPLALGGNWISSPSTIIQDSSSFRWSCCIKQWPCSKTVPNHQPLLHWNWFSISYITECMKLPWHQNLHQATKRLNPSICLYIPQHVWDMKYSLITYSWKLTVSEQVSGWLH